VNAHALNLHGLLLLESPVFGDERGSFRELWRADVAAAAGLPTFVQDNVSSSALGVVRGLHYQHPNGQGKLITVLHGAIRDVALDIRRGSPTFGEWEGVELGAGQGRQLYIPPGFAHGFQALAADTVVAYRCTAFYDPAAEGIIRWNDPDLAIDWPLAESTLSSKDAAAPRLAEVPPERLPRFVAAPLHTAR
jgi:dTDP-4-dehydrorhamnose 3,5-epimerase